jgi:hypothetical protein
MPPPITRDDEVRARHLVPAATTMAMVPVVESRRKELAQAFAAHRVAAVDGERELWESACRGVLRSSHAVIDGDDTVRDDDESYHGGRISGIQEVRDAVLSAAPPAPPAPPADEPLTEAEQERERIVDRLIELRDAYRHGDGVIQAAGVSAAIAAIYQLAKEPRR